MAQTIKLKRGTTTPTNTDIVNGEVAIDTSAKKLYINDGGTVKEIGGGSSATSGAGAPSSTPSAVGDIYIDTTNDVAYIATDTVSSSDWKLLTSGGLGSTESTGSVTLTSASNPMQTIDPQGFGHYVTLPNATTLSEKPGVFFIKNKGYHDLGVKDNGGSPLGFIRAGETAICGLIDNASSNGVWSCSGVESNALVGYVDGLSISASVYGNSASKDEMAFVEYDTGKFLLAFHENDGTGVYGIIFDSTAQTWGTLTTLQSGGSVGADFDLTVISTSQVLFTSGRSGAVQARVLDISGTTITANTEYSWSGAAAPADTYWQCQKFGSTYVLCYRDTANNYAINALTISGTVVSWGTSPGAVATPTAHDGCEMYTDGSSGIFVVSGCATAAGDIQVQHYSISGNTLTAGTPAEINGMAGRWVSCRLTGTNNIAIIAHDDLNNMDGYIASHSGGTVSISGQTSFITSTSTAFLAILPKSDRVIVVTQSSAGFKARVLIDTAGTSSAGSLFQNTVANYSGWGGPLLMDFTNGILYAMSNVNTVITSGSDINSVYHAFKVTESGGTLTVESLGVISDVQFAVSYYTSNADRGPMYFGGSTWQYTGDYKKCYGYVFQGNKFTQHLGGFTTIAQMTFPRWSLVNETGAMVNAKTGVASTARVGTAPLPPYMPETGAWRNAWGSGYLFVSTWSGGSAKAAVLAYRIA